MSNYRQLSRHPLTGLWGIAEYKDDYFGPRLYGVKFKNDEVVYPLEQVENARINEFWAQDVIHTLGASRHTSLSLEAVADWLNDLQVTYAERWKRDPVGGEGAVEHLKKKIAKEMEDEI